MGIETVTLKTLKKEGRMTSESIQSNKAKEGCRDTSYCIEDSHLMLDDNKTLRANSSLLASLAEDISLIYKDVIIERKFTSDRNILAGVTFDYRHLQDWMSYKEKFEPFLKEMVQENQSPHR